MIKIKIPDQPKEQLWDEEHACFVYKDGMKGCELSLEHSLLSVHKWEQIWCKPFLTDKEDDKTVEELLSYIECMTISPKDVDPELYKRIPQSEYDRVYKYINHSATATTFGGSKGGKRGGRGKEIITSEIIYFWMIEHNIPVEFQKWHLNALLALIRVCDIKRDPKGQKKMSANEIRRDYDKLNEMRRAKLHTKG